MGNLHFCNHNKETNNCLYYFSKTFIFPKQFNTVPQLKKKKKKQTTASIKQDKTTFENFQPKTKMEKDNEAAEVY